MERCTMCGKEMPRGCVIDEGKRYCFDCYPMHFKAKLEKKKKKEQEFNQKLP